MKILGVDIETSPNLADIWGLWNQNIGLSQLHESTRVICWGAKFFGKREVEFCSEHHDTKKVMITSIWKLLDEADVVVHYNGRRFDVPHLQREFLAMGLTPPAPYKQIDLIDTVRKQFLFPSNKLEYVSKTLGLKGKVKHSGHELWVQCMAGQSEAWEKMKKYNIRDVRLLEDLYERLLPWIPSHPSYGAMDGTDVCPKCGSDDLERRGFAQTAVSKFQRYRCRQCGGWSRSGRRSDYTRIQQIAA